MKEKNNSFEVGRGIDVARSQRVQMREFFVMPVTLGVLYIIASTLMGSSDPATSQGGGHK